MILRGGWPGRIVRGLNGQFGFLPADVSTGGVYASPLLDDFSLPTDAATEFAWVISTVPSSGTFNADDAGGISLVGAANGTYTVEGTLYRWPSGGPISSTSTLDYIVVGTGIGLAGANSTQAATSGTGAISQIRVLAADPQIQTATSDSGAIGQTHILAASFCAQGATSANGSLSIDFVNLIAASVTQSAFSASGAIYIGAFAIRAARGNAFYTHIAATATRLIKKYGASATLKRMMQGGYDPSTGSAAQTIITQGAKAVVFDYPIKFIDGTLIRQGDKQAYLSVSGATPKPGDVLTWGSVDYTVVSFKPLQPALICVLWELQVRS